MDGRRETRGQNRHVIALEDGDEASIFSKPVVFGRGQTRTENKKSKRLRLLPSVPCTSVDTFIPSNALKLQCRPKSSDTSLRDHLLRRVSEECFLRVVDAFTLKKSERVDILSAWE